MEREVQIRHAGKYFGSLRFFYENYFTGTAHVSRRTPKEVTVGNFTQVDLVELYSKFEPFEHKEFSLEDIDVNDKSFVIHFFGQEIENQGIDPRDFNIYPSDEIYFHKTLYDHDRGIIGSMKITVNCSEQTKNYYFKPLCPELKDIEERIQKPFKQINRHIMFEFLHEKIKQHFPSAFFW